MAGGGDPERRIDPRYADGDLVRVATARHQAEAEFLQALLLEEGIPSTLRRSMGFDVPDFLASGPRDVLVPRSGVSAARDLLLQAEVVPHEPAPADPSPQRLLLGVLLVVAAIALVAWVGLRLGA